MIIVESVCAPSYEQVSCFEYIKPIIGGRTPESLCVSFQQGLSQRTLRPQAYCNAGSRAGDPATTEIFKTVFACIYPLIKSCYLYFPQTSTDMMNPVLQRNNVQILGKGTQVMLFAHGFGCDQQSWQFIVDSFTDDYKVILFDYVGAGKSDLGQYDKARYNTLDGYAQDVLDICEALDLHQVFFVGHSVSSMIGLLAAIKAPQYFKKLIFIGPSPRYLNEAGYVGGFEADDLASLFEFMDSNYLGWSSQLAPAIMGNADHPEHGAFLTNSFCMTDP